MSAYDGYVYPEWSGLNDNDTSLPVENALKSAIGIVRHVWLESGEQRKATGYLARMVTGSECILLLHALEAALSELTKEGAA